MLKTVDMLSDLGKGLNPKNQLSKYDTGVRNTVTDYSMKSPFSMLLNVQSIILKNRSCKTFRKYLNSGVLLLKYHQIFFSLECVTRITLFNKS